MGITEQIETKNQILDVILMDSNFRHFLALSQDPTIGLTKEIEINLECDYKGEDEFEVLFHIKTKETEIMDRYRMKGDRTVQMQVSQLCIRFLRRVLANGLMRRI